jgi:methyl-accepting chemotaxis protein
LTQKLEIQQKDEIGDLGRAMQAMSESLRKLMRDISGGVQTLASSSTELSAVAGQTTSSVKELSSKANTVAAAAEESSSNTGLRCFEHGKSVVEPRERGKRDRGDERDRG